VGRIKKADMDLPVDSFAGLLKEVTVILKDFQDKTAELEVMLDRVRNLPSDNILAIAHGYREQVIPAMEELRTLGDKLEVLCPRDLWPFPSYMDLLFKL
jgi:glutamine synthetase